ncbi:MAG: hypothetical protein M1835_002160 [Candelina submexicana]|nr:MAG: hypothetical protein M1835_002160 [Candelina submexicana]
MAIEVTPLTEADIPGAIDTIQQAFADDPYNRWIFNDRTKFSLARNRVSLSIRCRWGIRNALFYVAKDPLSPTPSKVLGTALWLPPRPLDAPQTWDSYFQSWLLYIRQVGMNLYHGRGGLNVKRYYNWKRQQAVLQKELWTDPRGYYFCNIVTVLPEAQGKGVGKLLFREITARADREGMKCYLESSKEEPNIKIYERMGFQFCKELECDDDGVVCKLFAMIREPQTSKDKSISGS